MSSSVSLGRNVQSGRTMAAVALAAAALVASSSIQAQAGQAKTVRDGVFSEAQATRGAAVYKEKCQICHGDKLQGDLGPPLMGAEFIADFEKLTLFELVDKVQKTMPANEPGTLNRAQATDTAAFMLQGNKLPAGRTELSGQDASLKQITWPAGMGAAKPAMASSHGNFTATGNMAQVMRGILFPSSNLLFNVQNTDPGAQKVGWDPGKSSFSWADWGAGIYSGWEMVDQAALAISESAPIFLTPRRCENGKPAPVDRADWIKFTEELAQAGAKGYQIAQTRNREALADFTNDLADACLNCHQVYRDLPGGTTADPSNKAARCSIPK